MFEYRTQRDWLKPDGTGRRTWNKAKKRYYTPEQIYRFIYRNKWPYTPDFSNLHLRDLALASCLYLTSGRINEVLRLRTDQFSTYEEDDDILVCYSFRVSKRWRGGMKKKFQFLGLDENGRELFTTVEKYVPPTEPPILQIPMPRIGKLSPFTHIVEDYIESLGENEKLFKIGTGRAWTIIEHITKDPETNTKGYWPHWFRAQSLSYLINLLRSTVMVAGGRGVDNVDTLQHYWGGDWVLYKDELKS